MNMRTPKSARHQQRIRMAVIENRAKAKASSNKAHFPEHTRGAIFTARVSKQPPPLNPSTSFQPVPDPEIEPEFEDIVSDPESDFDIHAPDPEPTPEDFHPDPEPTPDDFPMEEELEEVTAKRLDIYNKQSELSYHDDVPLYNDYASRFLPTDDDDEQMQYISGSEDEDDNDEVSKISQDVQNNIGEYIHFAVQKGGSPAFSDSGASSAFSPPKNSSPFQRGAGEAPHSPGIGQVQQSTPYDGFKPPRPGSGTSPAPQPRPTSLSGGPALPKARITVQSTIRGSQNHSNGMSTQIHSNGMSTPVVSNGMSTPVASNGMSTPVTSNTKKLSVNAAQAMPPIKVASQDATPVVTNARKVYITPDSSPDRSDRPTDVNSTQGSESSVWSQSAVEQVTDAVGKLARLGQSFFKGPEPEQDHATNQPHFQDPTRSKKVSQPRHPHLLPNNPYLTNVPDTDLPSAMERMHLEQHPPPYPQQRVPSSNTANQSLVGIDFAASSDYEHPNHSLMGSDYNTAGYGSHRLCRTERVLDQHLGASGASASLLADSLAPTDPSENSTYGADDYDGAGGSRMNSKNLQDKGRNQSFSPMMRMRHGLSSDAGTNDDQSVQSQSLYSQSLPSEGFFSQSVRSVRSQSAQSAVSARSQMTEEEFHAMKQKKWKEKKKIADQTRAREKEKLEGSGGKKSGERSKRKRLGRDGLVNLHACHSGIQYLISNLLEGSCGRIHACGPMQEDGSESEEDGESTNAGSTIGESTNAGSTVGESTAQGSSIRSPMRSPVSQAAEDTPTRSKLSMDITEESDGDCSHTEGSITDGSHTEGSRTEGSRFEGSKTDGSRTEGSKTDGSRTEGSKTEGSRTYSHMDGSRTEGSRTYSHIDGSRTDGSRTEGSRTDGSRTYSHLDGSRTEFSRMDDSRTETRSNFSSKIDLDKFNDQAFIKHFISDISTEGIALMHHKEARNHSLPQPSPVTARLSLGSQGGLSGKFSEPRMEIRAIAGEFAVDFDIFDIRAIEKASMAKLKGYPLALPGTSILVRHKEKEYIFESLNEESAAGLVHGLQWLIPRLSFNLIIGNPSVNWELLEHPSSATTTQGHMQQERAMNDVANCMADKTLQCFSLQKL